MKSRFERSASTCHVARVGHLAALVLLVLTTGCPTNPPPDNGTDPVNGTDDPTAEVSGQILNISLSGVPVVLLGAPISVLYSVTGTPDSISGYYQAVADSNPAATAIGDRVIVATNLPGGDDQAFQFDPQAAGIGFFRVGILLTVDGVQLDADESDSEGIIQVQGPPVPQFVQPADAITTLVQGLGTLVSFDAGDPEGDVQWRLFYLTEGDSRTATPDLLGTLLTTGSGNVGTFTFNSAGLALGDYEVGVAATDTGLSVASTVAAGELDRIVTVLGPIIRVVAP